jgi:hypothetical protein
VGWALWWRHTTASTSSIKFIIYSSKQGSRATVLRGCEIIIIRNRRNLWSLLSAHKHLRKSSCAAFCPHPLLQLGVVPIPACRLLGIAVLMSSLIGFYYSMLHILPFLE